MINTVEKIYETNDDGTLINNISNIYKVVFQNGITSFVPHDEANKDYQLILDWIAEGNTITDSGGVE